MSRATERPAAPAIADRVVIVTMLDPYLSLRALAKYAGVSVRQLQGYINAHPSQALPAYRHGKHRVVVRRSDYDRWVERCRTVGRPSLLKVLRRIGLHPTSPTKSVLDV
jgi:hypothetical protein